MENAKLKKSQVTLELVLAFIVILLLFVGGLDIWFNLNNRLVTETRDYQSQRLASGQGNIRIPQEPVINATLPQLDEATLNKIAAIQACDCINDTLKQQAVDLYRQQYVLGRQIQTCNSIISGLKDSIVGMQNAYNQIPWCGQCCLCTIRCAGGHLYVRRCRGSLSNQCVSCSFWRYYWDDDFCRCIRSRPNPEDEHTQYRQDIQNSINDTQARLTEKQTELDGYTAEKTDIDAQIAAIEPALGCCGGVL